MHSSVRDKEKATLISGPSDPGSIRVAVCVKDSGLA